MRKSNVMVSVICMAYNHEKFIRQTLDGFIKQKTSFSFEVIVHDDASTDKTADIIKEYESQFPDIIKPIFQCENQYGKGINVLKNYILPKLRGQYLAWCEGDDYWTESDKLQKQVDALEQNLNCAACFSKVEQISYEGKALEEYYPIKDFATGVIKKDDFIAYSLDPGPVKGFPWQISGFMTKKALYQDYRLNPPSFVNKFEVGDLPLFLYVGLVGDVYYIDEIMSHYRTGNPHSWIGRTNSDPLQKAQYFFRKAKAYEEFDNYTKGHYHQYVQKAMDYAEFSALVKLQDVKKMKTKRMRPYYRLQPVRRRIRWNITYYCKWLERPLLSSWSMLKKLEKRK